LAGEEAGRRRLTPVEAVAAEEMMGTALWWRNSAAVMGFSRCGWRLEGNGAAVIWPGREVDGREQLGWRESGWKKREGMMAPV
jgi:hypothetical protein